MQDKNLKQVAEFHKTFGHPVRTELSLLDKDETKLVIALIQEELDEYKKAAKEGDIIEIADALGDIQYLLNGAFNRHGLGGIKEKILDEIHASNMSKACSSREEAEKMIDESTTKRGSKLSYAEVNNRFVIYRDSDGKVMKGNKYRKPELKKIIG